MDFDELMQSTKIPARISIGNCSMFYDVILGKWIVTSKRKYQRNPIVRDFSHKYDAIDHLVEVSGYKGNNSEL